MADRLWAPWRMQYVASAGESGSGCIFCDLPARNTDAQCLILHRGIEAFVVLNAYPYTSGHLMVAPFRHVADLEDLSESELLEVGKLTAASSLWLKSAYAPDGFNLGANLGSAAGAGVPGHLHWHVVPRWTGDTNFMAAVGETRVLPESLEESYRRLRKAVEAWRSGS